MTVDCYPGNGVSHICIEKTCGRRCPAVITTIGRAGHVYPMARVQQRTTSPQVWQLALYESNIWEIETNTKRQQIQKGRISFHT